MVKIELPKQVSKDFEIRLYYRPFYIKWERIESFLG
jgi:hypothetical protein